MYLLNTNVISEVRKHAGVRNPRVFDWVEAQPVPLLMTSVMCLMEIERGVLLRESTDQHAGASLRRWLNTAVITAFGTRILPVDMDVATAAAGVLARRPRPFVDALIAATARVRRLSVVTRNVTDFADAGVPVINPWQDGQAQSCPVRLP